MLWDYQRTPFLPAQTVYHLRVNWVQVPFSQITQQRSVKTISRPHTPRQILIYGKDKSAVEDGWRMGCRQKKKKATGAPFIASKEKYKSHKVPFMTYFGVLLNDPSVCLVYVCSFIQYFSN